jgi:hypothetical protein
VGQEHFGSLRRKVNTWVYKKIPGLDPGAAILREWGVAEQVRLRRR